MSQLPHEPNSELREIFFESAQELLQALNEDALKLEKEPEDLETVRSIRRTVHTLKGDSAACGFRGLSECAHALEDALAQETLSRQLPLAEVAFTAADTFEAMLAAYRQRVEPPSAEPLYKMIRQLTAAIASEDSGSGKTQPANAGFLTPQELAKLPVRELAVQGKRIYQIQAQIDPLCAMPIAARQLVLNALQGLGETLAVRPEGSATGSGRMQLLLASEAETEEIAARARIPTVISEVRVDELSLETVAENATAGNGADADPEGDAAQASAEDAEPAQREPAAPQSSGASDNVLRVEAERIDSVLNLVGELIIGKSMLQQAVNELARKYPKDGLRARFSDAMGFQARVLNELQRSVMKIRMVPVEQLFRRFPRLVRDVARQCGKEVELVVSGQDTDLDKGLLDSVAEPLTHLLRNAISHGIEAPEERLRKGKPAAGTIRLNAFHQANHVVVEIRDDGNGIDAAKVRAKALKQGLIAASAAAALNESEVLELIFRPGFSTAEQITAVSGRGVGLDVVQSVLQKLKGAVTVETEPGMGTTFRLKLPLTLAIITALLFRVEQRLYAVPLNSVAEITRARESDLHQVDRYEVLQLRDRSLSVIRLGRPPAEANGQARKIFVLVISAADRKLGLLVDSLEGEEELVIKPLDDKTVTTDLVSGASILGDGRVVLILNLAAIVERSTRAAAEEGQPVSFGLLLSQADRAQVTAHAGGGQS